jgi:VanZ family protein
MLPHNNPMRGSVLVKPIAVAAWASIAIIAYATLARVGFVYDIYYRISPFIMRPEIKAYAHVEHLMAFAVFGGLFYFGYPRRIILVCWVVLGSAVVLEVLQTLTPDRHGTLVDAAEKMVGGAVGIAIARCVHRYGERRKLYGRRS